MGGRGGGVGTPGFMSIAPCRNESDYLTATTVTFPVSATDFNYAPKCLLVTLLATGGPGMDVTFTGDFVAHPLEPSALRGAQSGNPITSTSAGTSKVFNFSTPGFFAYFCGVHNPSDNGAAMSGVVWVRQQLNLP
jgi:plastocyanin